METIDAVTTNPLAANEADKIQCPLRIRVEATSGWVSLKMGELWDYRELLYFFAWRDVKIRYKQTVMGISWAVLQPFLTMLIFSLFLGRLVGVPSDGVPYALFSFAALVPWTFFASAISLAPNSLVNSADMIRKIYFPRLMVPTATVLAGGVDLLPAFVVLLGMMVYYGLSPTLNVLWLPLFVLLAVVTSLGMSLWLSALCVQFRDVRYAVPFLTQAWFFATPIAYPGSLLSEPWRTLYALNPMVGVVEGVRWSLFGTHPPLRASLAISTLVAVCILVSGAFYFRRMERTFADVV